MRVNNFFCACTLRKKAKEKEFSSINFFLLCENVAAAVQEPIASVVVDHVEVG